MRRWILWAPLIAFGLLFGLAAVGLLRPSEPTIRSRLIGKPMPALNLPAIVPGHPGMTSGSTGPRLVNVFASWCVPCISEIKELERLRRRGLAIDGIAVRDTPDDLASFFADHGNPYRAVGSDPESRSMMALGSSGVPESFVVDARGIIRHQHIGAIGPQDIEDIVRVYENAR